AGFGMLLNFLNYKLEREGGKLVQVDRFYPSTKTCYCCEFKNDLIDLSIREWVCPKCKTHHDRDENAAKNIRAEGLRILSTNTVGQTEFQACGETVRLVNASIKQQVSVLQESPATLP
ncbi:MAG: transposase, partial [Moorea sp. SIO2B7]|nr:transposase [Moorena sp. SIO2B7]